MTTAGEELDLVALICSRLCHDLAGSIGAVNNGVELLAEETDPAMRDEAIGLIAQSAGDTARRLAFFRYALGASGSMTEPMALDELSQVARTYFAGGKLQLALPDSPGRTLNKALGKALLLGMLLAAQALPRGGTLALAAAGDRWRITAEGGMLRWPDAVAAALGSGDWPREPQAALARYAQRLAIAAGHAIAARPEEARLILDFG